MSPAPGADRYVALDFANSVVTVAGGHVLDLLDTPQAANRWLTERDLAPAEAGMREQCAAQLRRLREHIRSLIAAVVAGRPAPGSAIEAINEAMTRVSTAAVLRWDSAHGLHRQAAHPTTQIVEHALAVLAADAAELLTGDDAQLLTACGSPPCRRYLLRTHRRRHWCSVRCGDRARAARAYARRAARPGEASPAPVEVQAP
ncbi:ABATE domain-containing protein [Couchioplanes caeruleus]|uniref:Putative RNA-binding Zn ribbon-like protein n=1 Tax=Couchioplanes caeruleus TaxID=56438 RepID=A0A3N1GBF9_9ACTN|nr:ABATE domain-containing protein [Couchioplanes caeruleus]ROP27565.1 putative RNA-binding Zn ribbon-like protein [Couchioplanes caeruleus]